MTDRTVPIVSRRREFVQLFQKMQHGLGAFAVLFEGVHRLGEDPHGFGRTLGIIEVVASVAVIFTIVRAIRALRRQPATVAHHHHGHGVDWIDLALSAMVSAEVITHWHETGHWQRPNVLLAIVLLVLGLSHGRLISRVYRRRALKLTDEGMTIGGKFFTRFTARWSDIERIDITPENAAVVMRNGRTRRFNLKDMREPEPVVEALEYARTRLSVATPPAMSS